MEKRWYQKKGNIITLIICIIFIPILLMNLSIMIQANSDSEHVPDILGFKPFVVLSDSMETRIHRGDLIVVKKVDPSVLKEKKIIAFRDDEGTVTTHRIVKIVEKDGERYFVTKGDNNDSQDQKLVEYKDVEGVYKFRIPQLGNILTSLSKPTTIIIIVLVITIIFGFGFVKSSKNENKEDKEEFLEYQKQKRLKEQKEFEEFKKMKEVEEKTGKKED